MADALYQGGICFITDRTQCAYSCSKMVRMALKAGIRWVQLRDKSMSRRDLFEEAVKLRDITREHGAFFVVNDYADIAAAVDADGVHLGQDDLPVAEARRVLGAGKVIGISTHSEAEALEAEAQGADYIGFGPVFRTETKDAGAPRGSGVLGSVRKKVRIPVVAIGGIGPEELEEVVASGADAVAVASAILRGSINRNAAGMIERLRRCSGGAA
jgi:thiamine-phosphate pyrophosphorylase